MRLFIANKAKWTAARDLASAYKVTGRSCGTSLRVWPQSWGGDMGMGGTVPC